MAFYDLDKPERVLLASKILRDTQSAISAMGDPALHFVAKPFASDVLLDLICELVGVSRRGQLRPPPRAIGE